MKQINLGPWRHSQSQAGISLIGVLVALGIMGIVTAIVTQMLNNSMATQRHLDLIEEKRGLRTILERRLSCSNTLTKTILTGCLATLDIKTAAGGGFFSLKDKGDKVLGVLHKDGSNRLGQWGIKGRCVKSPDLNTVQIVAAKFTAKGGFATDPLNKKTLSWAPLFDADTPLSTSLCTDEILEGSGDKVEAEHLVSTPMDVDTKTKGCGDGLLGTILGGQTQLYKGTVHCPSNKIAVSGGTECMPGSGRGNLFTLIGGSPKGTMVASRPAASGQGWYVECCLKKGGVLGIGGKMPSPQAYVVCLDKPEK